jgi:hypothetical protein
VLFTSLVVAKEDLNNGVDDLSVEGKNGKAGEDYFSLRSVDEVRILYLRFDISVLSFFLPSFLVFFSFLSFLKCLIWYFFCVMFYDLGFSLFHLFHIFLLFLLVFSIMCSKSGGLKYFHSFFT